MVKSEHALNAHHLVPDLQVKIWASHTELSGYSDFFSTSWKWKSYVLHISLFLSPPGIGYYMILLDGQKFEFQFSPGLLALARLKPRSFPIEVCMAFCCGGRAPLRPTSNWWSRCHRRSSHGRWWWITLWLCQQLAIKNGHWWWVFPLKIVIFPSVMLNYQRVDELVVVIELYCNSPTFDGTLSEFDSVSISSW